jgi:hypothetical protein
MRTLALVCAALAVGCATAPEQPFGTAGRNPDQLALVTLNSSEVKIVEADGKPFPGSGTSDFYIQPGAHRFVLALHWCPGGQCISFGAYADKPRTACIDAKAGMKYRLSAGNAGPDWVPRVTEQAGGAEAKPIDARCP